MRPTISRDSSRDKAFRVSFRWRGRFAFAVLALLTTATGCSPSNPPWYASPTPSSQISQWSGAVDTGAYSDRNWNATVIGKMEATY